MRLTNRIPQAIPRTALIFIPVIEGTRGFEPRRHAFDLKSKI